MSQERFPILSALLTVLTFIPVLSIVLLVVGSLDSAPMPGREVAHTILVYTPFVTMVGLLFATAGMVLIALPAYAILRRYDFANALSATLVGAFTGGLVATVLETLDRLMVVVTLAVGALMGFVFWRLSRWEIRRYEKLRIARGDLDHFAGDSR